MKILYLDHAPYEGGAEVSLKQLVANLPDGYQAYVAAPPGAPYLSQLEKNGVTLEPFVFRWKAYKAIVPLIADAMQLLFTIWRIQPDVVHANTRVTTILLGVLGRINKAIPSIVNAKMINHVRDKDPLPRWKMDLIGSTDSLVANSHQVKDFLVAGGIEKEKITVIYNGVDLRGFNPAANQEEGPVIGFIGQIYPRKGLKYLVLALSKIREEFPNAKLKIVGQDPDPNDKNSAETKKLIDEHKLNENVEWVGYLDYVTQIPDFLSKVSVFVLPSLEEPFGRVLIDAMAMKIPVVASNVGGIPEIVIDGVTGFLVPPENSDKIAEQVTTLFRDANMRQDFGLKGRELVEKRFSLAQHVIEIVEEYNKITEK